MDEDVAAEKFREHLEWLCGDRAQQLGLRMVKQDRMSAVVRIPAERVDSHEDDYLVRLGADFYDKWPPTAAFVNGDTWEIATSGSRWLPAIQCQGINWFGLHAPYKANQNGTVVELPQLLCFTFTAEYYMVPHAPPEDAVWRQGYHTLAATVSRLAELLKQPHYRGPSGSGS